jgi:uncharacterized membrane protein
MRAYEAVRYLHIVGAIAWVGSGIGLAVLSKQLRASRDLQALLAVGGQSQALGRILFAPAALLTIVSGIALVVMATAIRFSDLWILIGFAGIGGSAAAQMLVAEPAHRRFITLAAEEGPDHPATVAAARRAGLADVIDVAVLLLVVLAMVTRPTL